MSAAQDFRQEVASGRRFRFGRNWQGFLSLLNEERIKEAERSLQTMLFLDSLAGRTFLDAGSGSGLFSLAAMRLGSERVLSFDYDPDSVACALELKSRYFPGAANWTIEHASVLDADFLSKLGRWDVVYSWGVLHHTGSLWPAIGLVAELVRPQGRLYISIYNDQGWRSKAWRIVKRIYNKNWLARILVLAVFIPYFVMGGLLADLIRLRSPVARYTGYKQLRGMSIWHDWLDWLGGYPFEVATPKAISDFLEPKGFSLQSMKPATSGCNEFIFIKN